MFRGVAFNGRLSHVFSALAIIMYKRLPPAYASAGSMAVSVISKRLKGKTAVVTASTNGFVETFKFFCEVEYKPSSSRIGFNITRRLAQEGDKVMVSSRKQDNVDRAVKQLRSEPGNSNLTVEGVVCHVGKPHHRKYNQRGRMILIIFSLK